VQAVSGGQSTQPQTDITTIPPDLQKHIDAVNASNDPNLRQTFVKTISNAILTAPNGMNPDQRQTMLQAFNAKMGNPGTTDAAQAPAQGGGFNGFAGPADLAQAQADVKLKNEPRIAYANDTNKNFADYEKGLNERVNTGGDLMMRIKESRDALSKFQAGGGMDTRAQVAKYAQAVGLPDSVVNKIAGGDIAAAQEFQKLSAQQAMETLKQAMGAGGRITQAEFKVFQSNNPNLDTDPRAIEKIYNFATKVYERDKSEQDALGNYKRVPGADMAQFPNYWSGELNRRGIVDPQQVTGAAKGTGGNQPSSAHPADIQALINKHLGK
jgi:hypothetical protein